MEKNMASEEGFTLIEAMIAIAIIGIGIMSMYTVQISSINSNSRGNRITISTDIAADKIEEIMALNYTDADLTSGAHAEVGADAASSAISWTVSDDDPVDNCKTIIVSVTTGRDTSTIGYIKSDL